MPNIFIPNFAPLLPRLIRQKESRRRRFLMSSRFFVKALFNRATIAHNHNGSEHSSAVPVKPDKQTVVLLSVFFNQLVGRFDFLGFLRSNVNHLLRQTLGYQFVRVVLVHLPSIGLFQLCLITVFTNSQ